MVIHILKVFSPSGSPTILVFQYRTEWQCSDGDPHDGGVERKGVWKIHDIRFNSEMMQDRSIATMEGK